MFFIPDRNNKLFLGIGGGGGLEEENLERKIFVDTPGTYVSK